MGRAHTADEEQLVVGTRMCVYTRVELINADLALRNDKQSDLSGWIETIFSRYLFSNGHRERQRTSRNENHYESRTKSHNFCFQTICIWSFTVDRWRKTHTRPNAWISKNENVRNDTRTRQDVNADDAKPNVLKNKLQWTAVVETTGLLSSSSSSWWW